MSGRLSIHLTSAHWERVTTLERCVAISLNRLAQLRGQQAEAWEGLRRKLRTASTMRVAISEIAKSGPEKLRYLPHLLAQLLRPSVDVFHPGGRKTLGSYQPLAEDDLQDQLLLCRQKHHALLSRPPREPERHLQNTANEQGDGRVVEPVDKAV